MENGAPPLSVFKGAAYGQKGPPLVSAGASPLPERLPAPKGYHVALFITAITSGFISSSRVTELMSPDALM